MLKKVKPTSAGTRHQVKMVRETTADKPEKKLTLPKKSRAGRNAHGHITTRHRGGGVKRRLRLVDFKRRKTIEGRVASIEYDPNRSASIALVIYRDGEKLYHLAPAGLQVGDLLEAGPSATPKLGNALPLKNIPVGMPIHNLELLPGKGGQIVRSAGGLATIQSKEGDFVTVKLPSGETRLIKAECFATIGQVSNLDHKNRQLGKAGRRRLMGWRPAVRGVAQHPGSHPHGGGEGRSGIGMPSPKSPWGKHTLGKKTRKLVKHSDKLIIRSRRQK
jgi:large subunit ribosomal protein L2